MQHAHIDETDPIEVVEPSKQLVQRRQGEQSQDKGVAQEIEQVLEKMDKEME